jgi:hypothetical protein
MLRRRPAGLRLWPQRFEPISCIGVEPGCGSAAIDHRHTLGRFIVRTSLRDKKFGFTVS